MSGWWSDRDEEELLRQERIRGTGSGWIIRKLRAALAELQRLRDEQRPLREEVEAIRWMKESQAREMEETLAEQMQRQRASAIGAAVGAAIAEDDATPSTPAPVANERTCMTATCRGTVHVDWGAASGSETVELLAAYCHACGKLNVYDERRREPAPTPAAVPSPNPTIAQMERVAHEAASWPEWKRQAVRKWLATAGPPCQRCNGTKREYLVRTDAHGTMSGGYEDCGSCTSTAGPGDSEGRYAVVADPDGYGREFAVVDRPAGERVLAWSVTREDADQIARALNAGRDAGRE